MTRSVVVTGTALGWDARLVRGRLPCKRQEWCDHVCPVRPGDPTGDRNQQPSASTETAPGHSGDGQSDQH